MAQPTPFSLVFDSWMLGLDASMVIGQRMSRLMAGDAAALREAQLMVTEKVAAVATLQWKAMTGDLGRTSPQILDASLRHYSHAVRKNQRRLSRIGRPSPL